MAFNFVKNINGPNFPALELLNTTASETYVVGKALGLSVAGLATGTTSAATHICMADYVAPASGMKPIACHVVSPNTELEVSVGTGSFAAIVPGNKLTIGTDFLTVMPETTNGVFTVKEKKPTTIVGNFA